MNYLTGSKNGTLYVLDVKGTELKTKDLKGLKDLMRSAGLKDLKGLDIDPRVDKIKTSRIFPEQLLMAFLPKEPLLTWSCPRCSKSWARSSGPAPRCSRCSSRMNADVNIMGLPWEN